MEQKRVFALGFFDGVHLGHQMLLRECKKLAQELGIGTAAITFEAHPQSLFTQNPPPLINTNADRIRLLRQYGMDTVYSYPVNEAVMHLPWDSFLEELLALGASGFVCGDDFRFGHRGEGNAEKLKQYCHRQGIPCVIVPEQVLDGVRISSTHIRNLIETGKMEEATRFLAHAHILTGTVVPGRSLGHKLGFPTANVLLPEGVVCPKHGVYACRVRVEDRFFLAVTNVGSRPTVNGHQVRTESWILDFDGDLYGKEIHLVFRAFLRPEQRFESIEALKDAVERDALAAREYFGK